VATNFSAQEPKSQVLPLVFGPHLAHGVNTGQRLAQCARVGYEWFCGDYPLHPIQSTNPDDGSSRKRLMTLLGQLARDAETREIEALLKQDPALSYHLLKLANSAAFAHSTPITSFGQAISVLGRRQLQRWLQLLLYARQQADGLPNPLLPIAAMRAAQMEALAKLQGAERDEQDLAFMTGVFSLLDLLFGMTMEEIVGTLNLPAIAADALLTRTGRFGDLLRMIEDQPADGAMLAGAGLSPHAWWGSQLQAYHWAIQVSRNL
jgi:EAL and modified HD-GYP domain-containing signal transduction protein